MIRLDLPTPPRAAKAPRRRSIAGAVSNRLTTDWVMRPLSADANLRWSLLALRARARELVLNYEYAARYVHVLSENVIGQHGLLAQPANLLGDRLNTELNRKLKLAWEAWGEPETCTVDGRQSWAGLQQLIVRAWPADGEVFLRMVGGFKNRYGFALQVLDPDLCDETFEREKGPGQNAVRMGVEIDDWNRPVAYWFWTSHPHDYRQDMRRERVRIPASEVVHLFVQYRPGQTRGYPFFTPVLLKAQMANGYTEAELVAARMGAAAMGFLETDPNFVSPDDDGQENPVTPVIEAEPGTFPELPAGKKLSEWAPDHPTGAFDPFLRSVNRSFAAGLNTSYATLTGDLSDASYSSTRTGALQERDGFQLFQQFIATHAHRRIYRTWLNWALLKHAVEAGTMNAADLWACWWQPRGWPWVDPSSDLDAAETEIRLGLKSRTTICMERGYDFAEVAKELAEEQKLAESLGLDITATVRPKVVASNAGASNDANRHLRMA